MLGHATAAMTLDLYGHLMSDDLAGVADKLGEAITAAQAGGLLAPEGHGDARNQSGLCHRMADAVDAYFPVIAPVRRSNLPSRLATYGQRW